MQTIFDEAWREGRHYYQKGHNIRAFNDDLIQIILEYGHAQPTAHSAIAFQRVHGAVSRIGVTEMAFPHRYDHYLSMMHPATDDPADTGKMIAWAREGWQALKPFGEGLYVNLLEDANEEGQDRVRDAYGPNYDRLLVLKRKYDPTNLFRQNANIIP